ncbi:hypothetical protein DL768_011818 [Monosporascus sp. mg162]|nr:hypothetical protein DL768_011818 [Monosporascus sp. mg162]
MPATTRSAWKRSTSNGGAANLRGSEEGGPQASDPVSGADPDSVSGVDPDVASGNDPGFATPTGPPQTSHETRASPKSRWKREKRPKTRRNNTKAVEKLYQKKRRLKKQAAKLRNTKKTDGSAAEEEEEEEGAGQFSDSDFQHDLPAAEVKQHQTPAWHVLYTTYPVVEEKYPLALTFSKTSTWLAMEDHPF